MQGVARRTSEPEAGHSLWHERAKLWVSLFREVNGGWVRSDHMSGGTKAAMGVEFDAPKTGHHEAGLCATQGCSGRASRGLQQGRRGGAGAEHALARQDHSAGNISGVAEHTPAWAASVQACSLTLANLPSRRDSPPISLLMHPSSYRMVCPLDMSRPPVPQHTLQQNLIMHLTLGPKYIRVLHASQAELLVAWAGFPFLVTAA